MDERVRLLLGSDRPEVTCEECFSELPRYVELEPLAESELDRVRAHLEGCPACREEYEVLRELVAAESG
jgi:predicted anti-sigma-YlaC factor YlaD